MGHRQQQRSAKCKQRGHAVIEAALLSPWIFLLFIGVLDFGFYAYMAIATANAARAAALYTSSQQASAADANTACYVAVEELRTVVNVGSGVVVPCPNCSGNTCSSGPISVTVNAFSGSGCPDYDPSVTDPTQWPQCSQVAVTYQGPQMMAIPGLMSKLNLTRVTIARVKAQ